MKTDLEEFLVDLFSVEFFVLFCFSGVFFVWGFVCLFGSFGGLGFVVFWGFFVFFFGEGVCAGLGFVIFLNPLCCFLKT